MREPARRQRSHRRLLPRAYQLDSSRVLHDVPVCGCLPALGPAKADDALGGPDSEALVYVNLT